jgi:hypothetical protein
MHNCKTIRNNFIELALDDLSPAQSAELLAELKDCGRCRDEFATVKSTLRTSGQALEAALPAEDFWAGYHARLETAIAGSNVSELAAGQTGRAPQRIEEHAPGTPLRLRSQHTTRATAWLALRSLLTTSVRVPAAVAAALVLLFGATVFFAFYSRSEAPPKSVAARSTESTPVPPRVIEVPVVKEKLVTRVVYVEANRRPRNGANDVNERGDVGVGEDSDDSRAPVIDMTTGVARVRPEPRAAVMSLAGFKPTDEVKLTIIKGSDPK